MNIYVDIDETICYYEKQERGYRDYNKALPMIDRILKINKLYKDGNKITYWTARGTVSKIDWYKITEKQLESWGCLYSELIVGEKPDYDLLICDKAVNSDFFFKTNQRERS